MAAELPSAQAPEKIPRRRWILGTIGLSVHQGVLKSLPGLVAGPVEPRPMVIDPAKIRSMGIRRLEGSRLTLYTDLPSHPAIEELPQVFEQAFPQWCSYFQVDGQAYSKWRCTAVLIGETERIVKAGLLPLELPPFRFGFARGREIWFFNPPSDYYRRHLLLHEGTHAFMNSILGNCGPTWYMEGIAELLASHRWEGGKLQMLYFPRNPEELPLWGRIRMIQEDLKANKFLTLEQILELRPRDAESVELYGWCWAAATFFERHPRYHGSFRQLIHWVLQPDFNELFRKTLREWWNWAEEEWAVFVHSLEYNHDLSREVLDLTPGWPVPPVGAEVVIAADRGWQNTGLLLEAGKTYLLQAQGRYQLATEPVIWWSEPGGVSIRYYRGRPLGILLAAVWPGIVPGAPPGDAFRNPIPVGLGTRLTPKQTGTLFLRINDSPGELADNAGTLTVRVQLADPLRTMPPEFGSR